MPQCHIAWVGGGLQKGALSKAQKLPTVLMFGVFLPNIAITQMLLIVGKDKKKSNLYHHNECHTIECFFNLLEYIFECI